MNVSSATDTPASAIKATLAALRPKKAASTNLLFLNFSSIFEMMIIIMMIIIIMRMIVNHKEYSE